MQLKVVNGLAVKVEGTWGTISDTKSLLHASNVSHDTEPESLYQSWVNGLDTLLDVNARVGGYYRIGSICVRVTDIKQAGSVRWADCEQPNGDIAPPVILSRGCKTN